MAKDEPPKSAGQAADPSMEDILASIRRILSEDETGPASAEPGSRGGSSDDVFDLDSSMMIPEERPPAPRPSLVEPPAPPAPRPPEPAAPAPPDAVSAAPPTGEARGPMPRELRLFEGGPTLEAIVRDALRPLLKEWLDAHLPATIERLYRAEPGRAAGRSHH